MPKTLRVVVAAALLLGLSSCAWSDQPSRGSTTEPSPPAVAPVFYPEGSADENLDYFTETLRVFSASEQPVEGEPVVNTLVEAGFNKAAMQVSFDRTKTDLVADSIFASVLIGPDCLLGQVVTADRTFVTTVQPAVGPEADICLIGETRTIDW